MPRPQFIRPLMFIVGFAVFVQSSFANGHDLMRYQREYDALVAKLDHKRIAKEFPKAVKDLDSDELTKVTAAIRTLAATHDPAVLPWLAPFLDRAELRVYAGLAIGQVVNAHELKRRDKTKPNVVILPRGPNDLDLRPMRLVLLNMFRNPNEGSVSGYAASMAGYLGLKEFEPEIRTMLKSRHPAIQNSAKFALEQLKLQNGFALTNEEIEAARKTAESFVKLVREKNEDDLGLLLIPKDAIGNVINEKVIAASDEDALYEKMAKVNTQRFSELLATFSDLSKLTRVRFEPGHVAESDFYAEDARVMKNAFVTLSNGNRIQLTIKIEEMVKVGDQFFISEID